MFSEQMVDRIRLLRLNSGLSQGQLAKELNVSGNYISMLERGKKIPSDSLAVKYAAFFGVDFDWLVSDELTDLDERLNRGNRSNLSNQFDGRANRVNSTIKESDVDVSAVLWYLLRAAKDFALVELVTGVKSERLQLILCKPDEVREEEYFAIIEHIDDVLQLCVAVSEISEIENRANKALDLIKQTVLLGAAQQGKLGVEKFFETKCEVKNFEYTADQIRLPGVAANYYVVDEMDEKWRIIYFSEVAAALMSPRGTAPGDWVVRALRMIQKEEDDADNLVLYATDRGSWAQVQIAADKIEPRIKNKYNLIYTLYCDISGNDSNLWWKAK